MYKYSLTETDIRLPQLRVEIWASFITHDHHPLCHGGPQKKHIYQDTVSCSSSKIIKHGSGINTPTKHEREVVLDETLVVIEILFLNVSVDGTTGLGQQINETFYGVFYVLELKAASFFVKNVLN